MTLKKWITDFLAQRGLQKPDGRPLFAYKATTGEYQSLVQTLSELTDHEREHQHYYAQAWLLFAAEWWKREYVGGAWRWAPLCNVIAHKDLFHPTLQLLVKNGRQQWNLNEEIKQTGKRFIGFVATNGGLPMRLIEAAQGNLSNLLKTVIEQSIKYNLSHNEIWQSIELRASCALPIAYQQDSVYELLTLLIENIIILRGKYDLINSEDPISTLNNRYPDWKDKFPLAIEGNAALTLIQGLITEASRIKPERNSILFKIIRGLRLSSDGSEPSYELSLSMQAQASRQALADALNISLEKLPPNFNLSLRIADCEYPAGEAIRRGENYQLIAHPLPELRSLYEPVQLIISRWGDTLHTVNLPGGEALNYDEPLIFESSYPFSRLLAQGDTVVKGRSALALAPSQAIVFSDVTNYTEIASNLVNGNCLLEIPEGETRFYYKKQTSIITVSAAAIDSPVSHWRGNTFNEISSSAPGLIFRGKPSLYIEQEGRYESIPSHEIYVRRYNSNEDVQLNRLSAPDMGRLIRRKGEQRLSSIHAIILPENAAIKHVHGKGLFDGEIHFVNWKNLPVCCETESISLISTFDKIKNTLIVKLTCNAEKPIYSVRLCFQWPQKEHKITLPFPGYGVALLNNKQEIIDTGSVLTLRDLMGCRALLMSANEAERWTIRLSTQSNLNTTPALSQDLYYLGTKEIRLFELIPIIRQMLSCSSKLDSNIKLEIINAHKVKKCIYVGNYSTEIRLHTMKQMISISDGTKDIFPDNEIADGLLCAFPLAKPEHDAIKLPLHCSEGVFTGNWLTQLPTTATGPWLIYAAKDSMMQSRPTVIASSPLLPANLSPLRQAFCESNQETRINTLRNTLQNMANNVEHEDWETLDLIINKLDHLPLLSLDIYLALSREPAALAMAVLLIDSFAYLMVERFPSELPFEWFLIPPQYWWNAFEVIKNQSCKNSMYLNIARKDIERKSQYLKNWQPALEFIFEQGLYKHYLSNSKDVRLFESNPEIIINMNLDKLFNGDSSYKQKMFRRNANEECVWPKMNNAKYLNFLKTTLGKEILNKSSLPINDPKLPAIMQPFIAAYDTYEDKTSEWQNSPSLLFELRQARQFDREWFDEAYCTGLMIAQLNKKTLGVK